MGYHLKEIPKGEFGNWSKIEEEFAEAQDAITQENYIMLLVELSDLLGAIEGYTKKNFNVNLQDLIRMKDATKRAFQDGSRQ